MLVVGITFGVFFGIRRHIGGEIDFYLPIVLRVAIVKSIHLNNSSEERRQECPQLCAKLRFMWIISEAIECESLIELITHQRTECALASRFLWISIAQVLLEYFVALLSVSYMEIIRFHMQNIKYTNSNWTCQKLVGKKHSEKKAMTRRSSCTQMLNENHKRAFQY